MVITILFVRCITLEGAGDGIYYYLNPVWSELKNVHVWVGIRSHVFHRTLITLFSLTQPCRFSSPCPLAGVASLLWPRAIVYDTTLSSTLCNIFDLTHFL